MIPDRRGRQWLASDAGHPLGRGYPSGQPLREDGESHRQAWMRHLRSDPCAYCGNTVSPVREPEGTVDHIDPQRGRPWTDAEGVRHQPHRGPDVHSWANLSGACASCNWSKAGEPLLLWLRRRRVRAG